MRLALAVAACLIAAPLPALATGGFSCTAPGGRGPSLSIVVGHGVVPQVVGVTLRDGARTYATGGSIPEARLTPIIVGQSWIDAQELRLDLLDAQALRFEGRLRARFQPRVRGRPAVGTLLRNGRTYRMRCVEA